MCWQGEETYYCSPWLCMHILHSGSGRCKKKHTTFLNEERSPPPNTGGLALRALNPTTQQNTSLFLLFSLVPLRGQSNIDNQGCCRFGQTPAAHTGVHSCPLASTKSGTGWGTPGATLRDGGSPLGTKMVKTAVLRTNTITLYTMRRNFIEEHGV